MRSEILRLVEAFPGISQGKVGRFMDCDVTAYVDALVNDGLLTSEVRPARLVGRPARRLTMARAPREAVPVSDRHADEHRRAKLRVAKWMMSLRDDPLTQEILAELMSAPHLYGREAPLADLMSRCGIEEGGKGWMRPAKVLAEMGVIELRARKGVGKTTTCWLREPPPYPLG